KAKELGTGGSRSPYVFNIIIFIISSAAISIYYLIRPIIEVSNHSLFLTIVTMAYPIIDLSIMFAITVLYYLSKYSKEKNLLLFIIMGFFLHVVADSGFAYLSAIGEYQPGEIIDLTWIVSILLIGFAGYYTKEKSDEPPLRNKIHFEGRETFFPYISTLILIILVINSYQWDFNALSLGLLVIVLMIIGRQLLVMNKNNRLMSEYRYLAYHDPLTGLNNRVSFTEDLERLMGKPNDDSVALVLLDLDRFKVINDTFGHYIGDMILIEASERLKQALGDNMPIYRLGGDEFIIILAEATKEKSKNIAKIILEKFQNPFLVNDYEAIVTPSIGISILPKSRCNTGDLFKHADAAMYLAKESGKNNFRFYNSELNKVMTRKVIIETELRMAIEKDQFSLFYQPKVDLQTMKIVGMEALLRWEHPELGMISPLEFIPIAEETGQIVPIGEWVLKKACIQNRIWQEKGFSHLCVSVNVSVRQFEHSDFVMTVKKVLQDTRLSPQFLEIEITESIMQNIRESTDILHKLRKLGVKASIDDFGTGYSSLHILQKLPIDTIKIDKSFIDDIVNSKQHAMVKTIIDLGLNLNLTVVAEGIEDENQLKILRDHRCSIGQGYHFSKAVHPIEFEIYLLKMVS
ncbi:MAG: GGDEF-domain containing protein, partial [Neobacillus sp.]|nr:GGDEF-domain containing protein [Neobacillus sp.]